MCAADGHQGDGTISRVDTRTGMLSATIPAMLPGPGGEICYGFGAVWATLIGTPIVRVDASDTTKVERWQGEGGDSIRAGHGSIWVTDLKGGNVWRFSPASLQ